MKIYKTKDVDGKDCYAFTFKGINITNPYKANAVGLTLSLAIIV